MFLTAFTAAELDLWLDGPPLLAGTFWALACGAGTAALDHVSTYRWHADEASRIYPLLANAEVLRAKTAIAWGRPIDDARLAPLVLRLTRPTDPPGKGRIVLQGAITAVLGGIVAWAAASSRWGLTAVWAGALILVLAAPVLTDRRRRRAAPTRASSDALVASPVFTTERR